MTFTFTDFINVITTILDIVIVWIGLFYAIKIVRSNSRTIQIFKGIIIIVIMKLFAGYLNLYTVSWIMDNFLGWGFLAIIVIFQPEIRGILERIGKSNTLSSIVVLSGNERENLVKELMKSVTELAKSKTGALISIEQSISLADFIKTGTQLNSLVSAELLTSIFATTTPLHDGAVIIQGDKLACASAYFPPTDLDTPSRYGARHRAAIGISQISDAITIVISEETGNVSVARAGELIIVNDEQLAAYLMANIFHHENVQTKEASSLKTKMNKLRKNSEKKVSTQPKKVKVEEVVGEAPKPKTMFSRSKKNKEVK